MRRETTEIPITIKVGEVLFSVYLPDDLHLKIVTFLNVEEFIALSTVNKSMVPALQPLCDILQTDCSIAILRKRLSIPLQYRMNQILVRNQRVKQALESLLSSLDGFIQEKNLKFNDLVWVKECLKDDIFHCTSRLESTSINVNALLHKISVIHYNIILGDSSTTNWNYIKKILTNYVHLKLYDMVKNTIPLLSGDKVKPTTSYSAYEVIVRVENPVSEPAEQAPAVSYCEVLGLFAGGPLGLSVLLTLCTPTYVLKAVGGSYFTVFIIVFCLIIICMCPRSSDYTSSWRDCYSSIRERFSLFRQPPGHDDEVPLLQQDNQNQP